MCKTCGCHSHSTHIEKEVLAIQGMTCEHCQKSVETAVRSLPGVLSAQVDLAANSLTVEFDHHKTPLADIKTAIEDIGFGVQ